MSPRSSFRIVLLFATGALAAAGFGGCGGGGGGGPPPPAMLVATSFVGTPPGPGVGLPPVFRDEVLELTFNRPLDDGVFGGFYSQGGLPVVFLGTAATGVAGTPYYAFVDQAAAAASLEIRRNIIGGALLASYIVGRHRDEPETIVVDPFVPAGNPFGLPPSNGFAAQNRYVFVIPGGNAFSFGGAPAAPFGHDPASLPVMVPAFTTMPEVAKMFEVGFAFGPNPVPPEVIAIDAISGAAGTPADPVTEDEIFIVTFSRFVTLASIDPSSNFVVRNVDVANPSFPQGVPVPGTIVPLTPGQIDDLIWIFFPISPYGPGVSPSEGYDVEVRIGSFGLPPNVSPPILGLPQGISGTQLVLSNSLSRIFRTTPCSACQTASSITEDFGDSVQHDLMFVQTFPNVTTIPGPMQCRWNDATAPGQLAGRFLDGSPTGSLGSRRQFVVDPQPQTTNPAGLFSPFDASLANSGGQCPGAHSTSPACNLGINPNGGSHIMHLYESAELGSTEDSLELIEWSPTAGVTAASTYPQYGIWCGMTDKAAPLLPLTGSGLQGLNAVFETNYRMATYQTGIPLQPGCADPTAINPRKVPCGGPAPYTVPVQTTSFHPFPVLSPCFDFSTSVGASGMGVNLLFEQNIEPGNQVPNFNAYRATYFNPVRRLIDRPLSEVMPATCPSNQGGQFDVYKHRFTFVGLVGQVRSLWYDTGAADPTYVAFNPSPAPALQPPGTSSVWILEGTDVSSPGPGTNGSAGVYIDANGAVHPSVLSATIAGLRYFRFRVELRGNNFTNAVPVYHSATMAFTF